MATHTLEDQTVAADLAQFVHCVDLQRYHALQFCLLHRHNASAANMLAQQHTKHRRLGRIITQLRCQMHARLIGACVQQQAVMAQQQDDLVAGRLLDLLNSRAFQQRCKLLDNGA